MVFPLYDDGIDVQFHNYTLISKLLTILYRKRGDVCLYTNTAIKLVSKTAQGLSVGIDIMLLGEYTKKFINPLDLAIMGLCLCYFVLSTVFPINKNQNQLMIDDL